MQESRQKLETAAKGCTACARQTCPNAGKASRAVSARSFFAGPLTGAPVAPAPRAG